MADDPTWREFGVKLLGGIAAGIGVLGFVTLVGGAVVEAQLSGAGLPSGRAVADLPRTDLLVIGARLLAPLAAVLAVVFLLVAGLEAGPAKNHVGGVRMASVTVLSAGGLVLTLHVAHLEQAAGWVWGVCIVVAVSVVVAMLLVRECPFARFVVAGVVAAGLASVICGYALAHAEPNVRPIAVLGRDGTALVGIYAVVNANEVAVGEGCTAGPNTNQGDGDVGYLVVVPRSEVRALAIGTNGSMRAAIMREKSVLASLSHRAAVRMARGAGPPYGMTLGPRRQLCTDRAAARAKKSAIPGGRSILLGP